MLRLQCPHCDTPLRDRHAVRVPPWLVAVGMIAALGISLFTARWTRMGLGLLLIASFYAPLAWAFWKARRTPDDPHRFVVGSTRFMARDNDDLRAAVETVRRGADGSSG